MSESKEQMSLRAEAELKQVEVKALTFTGSIYSASLFSVTASVAILLYVSCVIFLMPTEYLEKTQWDVLRAILSIKMMLSFSLFLMPFIVLLQMITGVDFNRKKTLLEFIAVLFSVLVCVLFFWPGWLF